MREYSILIGGRAGEGIRLAGLMIAKLFNQLGYRIFVYEDYPSLIKGGHNFSIIRASPKKILAHQEKVDILIALNQETIEQHYWRIKKDGLIIFDSNSVKARGVGIPLKETTERHKLPQIAKNTAAFGAFASILGINFSLVKKVIKNSIEKRGAENIELAKEAYQQVKKIGQFLKLSALKKSPSPLLTGNEAIALGAIKAGLKLYIAYPMTPATTILHYLAKNQENFNLLTIQPENEIAAIGLAQGASYAGIKNMIGTSGGGFALMVEHLSLAGQAEIPTVVVLSQRPGPATGLPTYTAQGDLFFALFAGHGEFPKIVLAPGDPEEAFYLSGQALNLAWKFQVPVIILSDKHLSESTFSTEINERKIIEEDFKRWKKNGEYKRYAMTADGVSPLTFPGDKKAIIKSNSYNHDEYGITTEEIEFVNKAKEKRLKKLKTIENYLKKKETIKIYGNKKSKTALITWGSTKGVVKEVGENLNLKVIQPLYLSPLPVWELKKHLKGVKKIISVEVNTTGQLSRLLKCYGFQSDKMILKSDGRPFTLDELEEKIKKIIL